ncbi:hypothetical protein [Frigidibacter oleivorans]|uniref:hypothetical protein n=1 Tax=Frigidibacter oleivorans TaxID=2487129 RepID=UPI0013DED29E|nr:hypothetical protein [Frigidibacter oleivorans]
MPWEETDAHNGRLLEALSRLAREKGALERLAGAINGDERSHAIERARRGRKHKERRTIVAESTLVRWQDEGLPRVTNAQPHKKRIVYEFLERSSAFPTDLYRPGGHFPPGLLAYAAEHGARLAQPFAKDLRKLDGAFELYRPAWTTPDRRDRVLVSRLLFTTRDGFTRFREEQDYIDEEFHGARIHEIDEGAVLFTAANIVLFALGMNAERVKLFVVNSWFDQLGGPLPVTRLSGSMMGVSGRRDHPGFPFVAARSRKPFAEIETGIIPATDRRLDDQTRRLLAP